MELNETLYNEILLLCDEGDNLIESERLGEAIEKYHLALELVPEPKNIWETSTWIYGALGDAYYLGGQYDMALKYLNEVMKCPGGLENSFIMLRIGQCLYELENVKNAQEYFLRAYMYSGKEIFEDEPEKYFESIKNVI